MKFLVPSVLSFFSSMQKNLNTESTKNTGSTEKAARTLNSHSCQDLTAAH
jgi:hypothetical protein